MPHLEKTFPLMGLGTFIGIELDEIKNTRDRNALVQQTVLTALDQGYRHIDLAENYRNLEAIGSALKQALKPKTEGGLGINRDDLWLTMKSNSYSLDAVESYIAMLGVGYLDTLMLHHPHMHAFDSEEQLLDTWRAMTALPKAQVKTLGVSNCYTGHITRLIELCEKHHLEKPFSNEVESNLFCPNLDTLACCEAHGIQVIAYSPLGYHCTRMILESEKIKAVAERIDATEAQTALAWHMARGVAVIPKSTQPERLLENFMATSYVREIDAEARTDLATLEVNWTDGLTETAVHAKAHAESLSWAITPSSRSGAEDEAQTQLKR